jgi:hypothetical protein
LLNVFLLPLSSFDAQETQLLTSSLLGLWCMVGWLVVASTLLWYLKTLIW